MSVADGLLNVTGKLKFPPSTTIIFNRYHWCIIVSSIVPIAVSVVAPTVSCSTGDCYKIFSRYSHQ
jgi:hypothetical protein